MHSSRRSKEPASRLTGNRASSGARGPRRLAFPLALALVLLFPAFATARSLPDEPRPTTLETQFQALLQALAGDQPGDDELARLAAADPGGLWLARARVVRAERAYRQGDTPAVRRELAFPEVDRADFLGAYAHYLLGLVDRDESPERALAHFTRSYERAGVTLLRYRAGVWLADLLRERGDLVGAEALLGALRGMPLEEALTADIDVRRALLLQSMGREAEARAILADLYLTRPVLGYRAATIPLYRIAREALEGRLDGLDPEARLARAEALEVARLHKEARLEALGLTTSPKPAVRDRARLLLARTMIAERAYRPALTELDRLRSSGPLAGPAALLRARALRGLKRADEAEKVLVGLAGDAKAGPARAEAALTLARSLEEKDPARALAYWRVVAEEPGSDPERASEARWALAWHTYVAGDPADAAAFAAYAAESAVKGSAARGTYWAARALARQGRADEAATLFRSVATAEPEGYYGLLAARRLVSPESAETTESAEAGDAPHATASSDPARPLADPRPEAASVSLDPLRDGPEPVIHALAPAQEMARLGLAEDALAEAQFQVRRFPDEPAPRLVVSEAYHRTGDYVQSVRWLRRAFPDVTLASLPPAYWKRLYPLSYWDSIERYSRGEGLDPFLAAALIYQESRFLPLARSGAGAYGLMQLLPGTAREVARSMKEAAVPAQGLYEPDRNLRYGLRYLKRLLDLTGGKTVFALAGYNAGAARVRRWSGGGMLDTAEFVEIIPFQETRDYVKSILVAHEAYHRIYAPQSVCHLVH